MEYSELQNIILGPFATFINGIHKKWGEIDPIQVGNGQWIYPCSWHYEMDRFNKEHKSILDARLLVKNFINQQDPDLRHDIESDMMRHIMKLIVALHKIRGEEQMHNTFRFIDDMLEYLGALKNAIGQAPVLQKAEKPKKPYRAQHRAYGIYFYLLYEKEDNKSMWGDNAVIESKIKELGCHGTKRAAQIAKAIFLRPEELERFKHDPATTKDYYYAWQLFKAKYPDDDRIP